MKHAMFEQSADATTLAHVLRSAKVGDTVTYSDLSAAIGRDVREDARSALTTARRIVLREDRMVFDAIRSEGLQRLTDESIVDLSDRTRDHIRRVSRRTASALVCVDYPAMTREAQTKHNVALSMLGVVSELMTEKANKRLASAVTPDTGQIPAVKAAIAALGAK